MLAHIISNKNRKDAIFHYCVDCASVIKKSIVTFQEQFFDCIIIPEGKIPKNCIFRPIKRVPVSVARNIMDCFEAADKQIENEKVIDKCLISGKKPELLSELSEQRRLVYSGFNGIVEEVDTTKNTANRIRELSMPLDICGVERYLLEVKGRKQV